MRKVDKGTTKVAITVVVIAVIVSLVWYLFKNKEQGDGFIGAGLFGGDAGTSGTSGSSGTSAPLILQGLGIVGSTPSTPDVFTVSFGHGNAGTIRPHNGAKYKNLIHRVLISGTPKWNGIYNTRPGWFFIDSNGRLGNIIIEGSISGNYSGPVTVKVLS